MPSHKFQRIVRELSQFGDTVNIKCTKEGVEFCTPSDNGPQEAKILYQPSATVDSKDEVSMQAMDSISCTIVCNNIINNTNILTLSGR